MTPVHPDDYVASVRIAAPPDAVFPYFTDPALLVRWMGDWADLRPKPGGDFTVDVNGVPVRGEYVVVEPPHRLVFTWGVVGNDQLPPGASTVEVSLQADGDETVLELVHRDLPPEERARHAVGWPHFLDRCAVAASGRDPGPDPWAS